MTPRSLTAPPLPPRLHSSQGLEGKLCSNPPEASLSGGAAGAPAWPPPPPALPLPPAASAWAFLPPDSLPSHAPRPACSLTPRSVFKCHLLGETSLSCAHRMAPPPPLALPVSAALAAAPARGRWPDSRVLSAPTLRSPASNGPVAARLPWARVGPVC